MGSATCLNRAARAVLVISASRSSRDALASLVATARGAGQVDRRGRLQGNRGASSAPDLVVLDAERVGDAALDFIAQVRRTRPHVRTLVLVTSVEQQTQAQVSGCDVALVKGYPARELIVAVEGLLADRQA